MNRLSKLALRRWSKIRWRKAEPKYTDSGGGNETQKIITHLIPEQGLDYTPEYVREAVIDNRFSRVFAHLVGKIPGGSRLLEGTTTGALKVANTGSGLESYTPYTGVCVDAYASGQTHESTDGWDQIRLLIETHDVVVAYKNAAGTWGSDEIFPVGEHGITMSAYGVKLKNRDAGLIAIYQVTGLT